MGGGGGCIPLEFPPQKIIARMDFETDPWNLSQPQLSLRKICNWFLSLTLPLQALPPTVLYVLQLSKRVKFISCGFYQVDCPSCLGIYMYC